MKKNIKIHVKKGDQVKVISGEQKGFLGIINSIVKKKSSVILEGIIPRIKYVKNAQNDQNQDSKKIEVPVLIHSSNVMLWDKIENQASRVGFKEIDVIQENGIDKNIKRKVKKRYFKKSGNLV